MTFKVSRDKVSSLVLVLSVKEDVMGVATEQLELVAAKETVDLVLTVVAVTAEEGHPPCGVTWVSRFFFLSHLCSFFT